MPIEITKKFLNYKKLNNNKNFNNNISKIH